MTKFRPLHILKNIKYMPRAYRENQLVDKMMPYLGNYDRNLVKLKYSKSMQPGNGGATTDTVAGRQQRIYLSLKQDPMSEATLAHELGHVTGPASGLRGGNPIFRNIYSCFNMVGNANPGVHLLLQTLGGGVGSLVSGVGMAGMLGEEAQASIRGLRALKKARGYLTAKEKFDLLKAYGTYVRHAGLYGLALPKLTQHAIDIAKPGFAAENKVLADHIMDVF